MKEKNQLLLNKYTNKALKKIKEIHPWVSKESFSKDYKYKIEQKEFVVYYHGEILRKTPILEEEKIIKDMLSDQEWWIESQNPVKEVFKLSHNGEDIGGWTLENYEFRKHEKGGYSSNITAGNRSAGGSRTFFIPSSFLKGTFDDFIQKYNNMVPGPFILTKDLIKQNPDLKRFLTS